uniref:Glycosyltransferase n=1 Tax=Narcissus tazetta subsp. chinensis TaxID=391288 RepID=A0A097P5Z5_NARTA|nr:UDP glucose-flavonoid 3-O-glucosyltransferase 1 [Narcissus tazetta subsp. chinensis]
MGSGCNRRHVALLAFPFGTHAAPLFSLARALATATPSAGEVSFTFLTSARSAASLGTATCPPNLRIFEVSDGRPEEHASTVEQLVGRFMAATPGNFESAMEAAVGATGGLRFTCLISDAFLWFVGEMAAGMEVPWVALWTGGPSSLSAHLHTDLLRGKFGVEEKDASLDEDLGFIRGLSGLRIRDLPDGITSGDVTGKFSQLVHMMGRKLPTADAVVFNSFQGLNSDLDLDLTSKLKKTIPIGPIHLWDPTESRPDRFNCVQWLDQIGPATVVYISFGTHVNLQPPELAELAEGLEASGFLFLWSLKDSAKEHLPAGFLDRTKDRGLVVPWVPQVEVLAHAAVGAFVTHGGWNSVLESITGGVPMVCRPFLGDQMMNARAISHVWKVGARFEGGAMKKDEVVRVLGRVVEEEEGRMMRERMRGLKEIAVRAVRAGGSSVQNLESLVEMVVGR